LDGGNCSSHCRPGLWILGDIGRDGWNEPHTQAEVDALREAARRSRPYGTIPWTLKLAGDLHLEWTPHPRGRSENPKPVDQNQGNEQRL
jgi:hypothetical protein